MSVDPTAYRLHFNFCVNVISSRVTACVTDDSFAEVFGSSDDDGSNFEGFTVDEIVFNLDYIVKLMTGRAWFKLDLDLYNLIQLNIEFI